MTRLRTSQSMRQHKTPALALVGAITTGPGTPTAPCRCNAMRGMSTGQRPGRAGLAASSHKAPTPQSRPAVKFRTDARKLIAVQQYQIPPVIFDIAFEPRDRYALLKFIEHCFLRRP
jgi:hypothetical protein